MQRHIREVEYLIGSEEQLNKSIKQRKGYPRKPFDSEICEFLDALSRQLRMAKEVKTYPDLLTFAFWCRKSNLKKLEEKSSLKNRIGRGLVFHIPPTNVPVNFAFSLVFGLLSGNANVVRISPKMKEFVSVFAKQLDIVLTEYEEIRELITFVSYDRDDEITAYFSSICQGRVVWGGDATISAIHKISIPPRAVEVHFADRYSFGIVNEQTVEKLSEKELQRFAEDFYNDTYLMDQNACSSPGMLFWINTSLEIDIEKSKKVKERFYRTVAELAKNKYDLEDKKVSDKYTSFCEVAMKTDKIKAFRRYDNILYIASLEQIEGNVEEFKGKYGMFYECNIKEISEIKDYFTAKTQTCLVKGISPEDVASVVMEHHMMGIDRIVPFGQGLAMDIIWDGYEIINELSRRISF